MPATLLSLPDPLLDAIAGLLPQEDRRSLGATCTRLREASFSWPFEITTRVDSSEKAEGLLSGLRRYSHATVHLHLDVDAPAATALLHSLAERPGCLSSLKLPSHYGWGPMSIAQLAPFTRLGKLEGARLESPGGSMRPLSSLTQLTSLHRVSWQGDWAGLSSLAGLLSLELAAPYDVPSALGALSALSCLTRLGMDLGVLEMGALDAPGWPWQHLGGLSRLRELEVGHAQHAGEEGQLVTAQLARLAPTLRAARLSADGWSFDDLVPQLALCTGLTRLDIQYDINGDDGRMSAWELTDLAPLAPSLRHLELSGCQYMDCLSEARLADLTGLTHLALPASKAPFFWAHDGTPANWEWLASFQQLRHLNLSNCTLEEVPALAPRQSITSLDLSHNAIGDWRHLPVLAPTLVHLDISRCQLAELPSKLTALCLTSLDLSCNSLRGGWEPLRALKRTLASLNMGVCQLAALPAELSALSRLTTLQLYRNPVGAGWQHLQALGPTLVTLNLAGCQLAALPAELSALTRLECLDLSWNSKLKGGWDAPLQPLTRLSQVVRPG